MILGIDPEPMTILDVGPGAGQWYDLLRPWFPQARFQAIEIFEPYVERYKLRKKYKEVFVGDARLIDWGEYMGWDLVIFGDVIEHMEKADAVLLVGKLLRRYALISIPIGPCPQDGTDENPHEEHVATWTIQDVLASFPVVHPYYSHMFPPPHYGRGVFLLEKR